MLMETETMLPADLAPVAAPALTPWGMYLAADVVVKGVMIALALASLATWTVLLAKGWELARQARQLRAARALLLQAPSLPAESAEASAQQGTALAMLEAARTELRLSQDLDSRDGIKERVASRLDRIELETARLQRRGIGVLASIGAVAPFVGLFGTVWGVYHALVGIGLSDGVTINRIAGPVGEALIMTGLGLAVAIPAVLAYNTFVRNNRVFLSRLDAFAHDLFAFLTTGQQVSLSDGKPYGFRDQHGAPDRRHAGAAGDLHQHGAAPGALDQDQHAPGGRRADRGRTQDRGPGDRCQRRAVLGRKAGQYR
ncbi:hypothetical protein G6F22_013989 [Rhizopus arrhizus]|nr:hypothetical protein G6F22_013989 [Rhizopus arrhizus]